MNWVQLVALLSPVLAVITALLATGRRFGHLELQVTILAKEISRFRETAERVQKTQLRLLERVIHLEAARKQEET
jgi:hypothetical protein